MQAMEATTPATKVIYGVNELDLDLAGKSIRGIWKALEQVLNIPRDAAVSVNGERAGDDYVVRPGDEIEFQKQAGVKGLLALTPANADARSRWTLPRRLRAPAAERSPNAMQSRTFLRIEGDLVSLVTEVIDREVTPPGPPDRAHHRTVAMTPRSADRLPLLDPLGDDRPLRSSSSSSAPSRRTIEYHASRRHDSEPTTYRLAAAVRRLRRLDDRRTDRGAVHVLPDAADRVARRDAALLDPAEHLRRRARLSRIGPGQRAKRRRTSRRPHRRVLGEPLQPGPPPASAAFQRRLPGLGVPLPARSTRGPVAAIRPLLADPPPGRGADGRAGDHGSAGRDTRYRRIDRDGDRGPDAGTAGARGG